MWAIIAYILSSLVAANAVSLDSRALIINNERKLLLAATIHYPRSTPDMWPDLFQKTKDAGLNAIDTYVFWDQHEATRGSYNFTGNLDLFRFIKLAQEADLYVILRIGPYVCAEWNFGGFPYWLKELEGVAFRTYNNVFMAEMERFTKDIVNMAQPYLFDQGGPIIALQIENEFGNIQHHLGQEGVKYINWAVDMAQNITKSVPWFVCVQDTVSQTLNTCNGFYCDEWIQSRPFKHQMAGWTENWTGWFQNWGENKPYRPVQDLVYSVSRFIARGGTYIGYYMWHGGTNFGRSSGGPGITTSYDYDAPLDEFGFKNEPKYSHLAALNSILIENSDLLLNNDPVIEYLNANVEASSFGSNKDEFLVFLSNKNPKAEATVSFHGNSFTLPRWSVSILKKSKDGSLIQIYNTALISGKGTNHSYKTIERVSAASSLKEPFGIWDKSRAIKSLKPLEQLSLTHDKTDYLYYQTKVSIPKNVADIQIDIESAKDVISIYLDDERVVSEKLFPKSFSCKLNNKYFNLKNKRRKLKIVTSSLGLDNTGAFAHKVSKGITRVTMNGVDITENHWIHQAGLKGECESHNALDSKKYKPLKSLANVKGWRWFKFNLSPIKLEENTAYVIDLGSMGKGYAFVNGKSIGRYWNITGVEPPSHSLPLLSLQENIQEFEVTKECDYAASFKDIMHRTPAGDLYDIRCRKDDGLPSQRYYHVPREWIYEDRENQIVLWEEIGGDLHKVELVAVKRE